MVDGQNGKEPVFLFQANAALGMDYYSRRVLTGAAVDGRVTERFGSALSCECGLRSPDREHLTFHCQAQPWDGEFRSATERRLLVPLVDAPPVLPFSNMVADPAFGYFYSAIRSSSATHLGFGRQLYHSYFL